MTSVKCAQTAHLTEISSFNYGGASYDYISMHLVTDKL